MMLLKIPDDLTLETPEQVRALRDLLDAYLRLQDPTGDAQQVPATRKPNIKGKGGFAPTMGPQYRQTLNALGGTGSLDEIQTQFFALGFKTNAKNLKEAIYAFLRHNAEEFEKLPPDDQGVVRWTLKTE